VRAQQQPQRSGYAAGAGIMLTAAHLAAALTWGIVRGVVFVGTFGARKLAGPELAGRRRHVLLAWLASALLGVTLFAPGLIDTVGWLVLAAAVVLVAVGTLMARLVARRRRPTVPPPPGPFQLVARGDYEQNARSLELEQAISELVWHLGAGGYRSDEFVDLVSHISVPSARRWVRLVVERNLAALSEKERAGTLDPQQTAAATWLWDVTMGIQMVEHSGDRSGRW
jgi:hypothetical protein